MNIEENPNGVTAAELIVGIPSYNEAELISYPTQMASEGLVKYFGDKNSVIINCDNNSPDGTRDAFLNTPTEVPKIYLSTPPGMTTMPAASMRTAPCGTSPTILP